MNRFPLFIAIVATTQFLVGCETVGNSILSSETNASRLIAAQEQYTPESFRAYGVLAFRSIATDESWGRYLNICRGFIASIPESSELASGGIPLNEQMATVWPVDDPGLGDELRALPAGEQQSLCPEIVKSIDLQASREAIRLGRVSSSPRMGLSGVNEDFKAARERFDSIVQRRGPFLIAWSPAANIGQPETPILVADLSDVTTADNAIRVFQDWTGQIVANPELWGHSSGWDLEKLRDTLRLWADRYGANVLKAIGFTE